MKKRADKQEYFIVFGILLFFTIISFLISSLAGSLTGYSVFGYNSEANLTLYINSTNTLQNPINSQIYFYANFTNSTDGLPINLSAGDNVMCNFTQNSSGSWAAPINMTYDEALGIYSYNMSFSAAGMLSYNITCYGNDSYGNLSLAEDFFVSNCIAPASGDWIINESANIACENVDLQINGSVNITDNSTLSIANMTFNSSGARLSDLSRMILVNSSFLASIESLDNSSLSAFSSQLNASVILKNYTTSIISDAIISQIIIFLDQEASIENLSSSATTYISQGNFVLNLSAANISKKSISSRESINISSSIIYNLSSFGNIRISNSSINITSITAGNNFTANNITIVTSADIGGDSRIILTSSGGNRLSAGAGSNINISSSALYNLSFYGVSSIADSRINFTWISPDSNITAQNISIISGFNAPANSSIILNLSSAAGYVYAGAGSNINITSSLIYNLTSYADANTADSIFNITNIADSTILARNITISNSLIFNAEANATITGTVQRISTIGGNGKISLYGNLTISQKSMSSFSSSANITRFYPVYIYDGSDEVNGSMNVTHNGALLWSGTLLNSYVLINLTFNSTTQTNQYNLNTPIGYVGKISLLDNTPVNKSAQVSSIALSASLVTTNGTLFNDTAYLQFSSNKDITCIYASDGENYTNSSKTASYYRLYNGTYLTYNSTLKGSMPMLNSTHLLFILSRNVFSEFRGSNDNDVTYTESFYTGLGMYSGSLLLLGYGVSPYPTNKNASTYIYFANNNQNQMYNYRIDFNNSIIYNNFSELTVEEDLLGSTIKMQGVSYNISALNAVASGNGLSSMTLSAGNTTIQLRASSGKIKVNGTDISNAYGYFLGTPGNMTGLNMTFYPNDAVYLAEGDAYTDPVFGRLKFVFTNLNVASTENISFTSSQGNATLNFTDINNMLISIPYYSNGTMAFRGYNSTRRLLAKGENYTVQTAGSQVGMLFFYVKNSTGEAHLLRLAAINTSTNTLNLSDDANSLNYNSSYYNSSDNLSVISLGSLGNLTLNISSDHKTINYQDAPRISAKTKYGADVQLNSLGAIFNENNASSNNQTIQVSISVGANWTYDSWNTLTSISKVYGDTTIKLSNTRYGSIIEDDNQNNSYITIMHPESITYADVYLAGAAVDNSSLIAGTLPLSSRYTTSSIYTYNNLSLTCTDGIETAYFNVNVNVSSTPEITSTVISTGVSSATINLTTNITSTASLKYGTTSVLQNTLDFNTTGTEHGILLSGLASDTNFYYNLTVCDIYSRCFTTGPNIFTTLHQQSASSATINYVDSSTIINVNPFANRRFADMIAGETYSSEMNYGRVPVTIVEFKPKKDIDDIVFTFFTLKNSSDAPSLVEKEKLYHYMNFSMSKASFDDLEELFITFRVDKTWFDMNNHQKESITLNRYTGEWQEVSTEYVKQDPFYHYYKAKMPGFSIFAITATKGNLPAAAPQPIQNETIQSATDTTPTIYPSPSTQPDEDEYEFREQSEPEEESPSEVSSISERIKELTSGKLFVPLAIAVFAVMMIGGGVLTMRKPKSMVQELAKKQMTNEEIITELKAKGVYGQSLEELRQFISGSVHQGKNANEIKAALLSVGWEDHIIDDVFQLFNIH